MVRYEKGPAPAGGTADAGEFRGFEDDHFPVCPLHSQVLVDSLPLDCPLAGDTRAALQAAQDRGWAMLAPGLDQDVTGGLWTLRRFEICCGCSIRSNPWVGRLRAGTCRTQGTQPEPQPVLQHVEFQQSGPVRIRVHRMPARRKVGVR
jgi:hypothetical protein